MALVSTSIALSAVSAAADDTAELKRASAWRDQSLAGICGTAPDIGKDTRAGQTWQIRYRMPGQDQDSPDLVFPLFQLACGESGGNPQSIFLTRDANGFRPLAFAEPVLRYDYTDESFTALTAPPQVTGFRATLQLANARFDPATGTISMKANWSAGGEMWSAGRWVFSDGAFKLREFAADPIFGRKNEGSAADDPGYFTVYRAPDL